MRQLGTYGSVTQHNLIASFSPTVSHYGDFLYLASTTDNSVSQLLLIYPTQSRLINASTGPRKNIETFLAASLAWISRR